jgi:hypothetical protein
MNKTPRDTKERLAAFLASPPAITIRWLECQHHRGLFNMHNVFFTWRDQFPFLDDLTTRQRNQVLKMIATTLNGFERQGLIQWERGGWFRVCDVEDLLL